MRRGPRFKYVHFTALPALLFDLESDPGELRDLAGSPEHAGTALAQAQAMLSWRMAHAERRLTGTLLTERGAVERRGPGLAQVRSS